MRPMSGDPRKRPLSGRSRRPLSGGTSRPQSAAARSVATAGSGGLRQRAIYSEALIPAAGADSDEDEPQQIVVSEVGQPAPPPRGGRGGPRPPATLAGPSKAKEIRSLVEMKTIIGSSFKRRPPARPGRQFVQAARPHGADVAPKVCEPFEPLPGRPPRKVRVERLRRQYEAMDLEELLLDRGVDYADPAFDKDSLLALEHFDDTEFDTHTPQEWLELATDHRGTVRPLAAKALRLRSNGTGTWRPAFVQGFDEEQQRFVVRWDGDLHKRTELLSRLRVLLMAEDPVRFADRLAAAHEARRHAEARIKYNFVIDSMPTVDAPTMNAAQSERLLDMVLNRRKLEVTGDGEGILQEVQQDYARAMSRIVFDSHLLWGPAKDDPEQEELCEVAWQSPLAAVMATGTSQGSVWAPAPMRCLVPVPPHPFAETFGTFCIETLRVRPEVVLALQGVRAECERVATQELVYFVQFLKPLRLDEFRQQQRASLKSSAHRLKEVWTNALQQIVLAEFSAVGKGWFNISGTSRDLFKRGKLVRFLSLVRLMMQDALREVASNSVSALLRAVDGLLPSRVEVKSPLSQCGCFYADQPAAAWRAAPVRRGSIVIAEDSSVSAEAPVAAGVSPLFVLDAARRDAAEGCPVSIELTTEPARFVQAFLEAFDAGLEVLGEVPALEHLLLPHFARTHASELLNAVDAKSPEFVRAREELEAKLVTALAPLDPVLELFKEHEELMRSDPVSQVEALARRSPPLSDADIEAAVQRRVKEQEELLASMPEAVHVGLCVVQCKDLRKQLASKHESATQLLLDVLLQRFREQAATTLDQFNAIAVQLRAMPRSVEELQDIRRFAQGVPRAVMGLRDHIARDVALYERLEDLRVLVSKEDSRQRWTLVGAPRNAQDMASAALLALQRQEEVFTRQLIQQELELDDFLDDVDQSINMFLENPDYHDATRYREIADVAANVGERMATAAQQAELFSSREQILGRPGTDYPRLAESRQAFEPYSLLWRTVSMWMEHRDRWRNGLLFQIDVSHLVREVKAGVADLERVCELFGKAEFSHPKAVVELAARIRGELKAFEPSVPLVAAMRTEGMSKALWAEVAVLLGEDIINSKALPTITLAMLLERGALQKRGEVEAIAERAAKEHAIELQLRHMHSEWDQVHFECSHQYRDTGTFILQGGDVVVRLLDEQLRGIGQLQASDFKGALCSEIDEWATQLRHMAHFLEEWLRCQRRWQYLQPVFDSPDVMVKLPGESRRFRSVDSFWRREMKLVHDNAHALTCLMRHGHIDRWVEANQSLEAVQRSLDDFLQLIRPKSSRFYFISNDELLEIIFQTKVPQGLREFGPYKDDVVGAGT